MKYILIALTLVAVGCTGKTDKPAPLSDSLVKVLRLDSLKKSQKFTQEKTIVLYPFIADKNDWRIGAAFKNMQDTVISDTMTHLVWYRVAVSYKVFDTLGKPVFDKYGLQKDSIVWLDMSQKNIIQDYKKDWSELISQPKQQPNK